MQAETSLPDALGNHMDAIDITIDQLRGLLGLRVQFRGEAHTIIEVIEDGPAIVLAPERDTSAIQPDAYGNARRQARVLLTIPLLTPDRRQLHADFLELDLL